MTKQEKQELITALNDAYRNHEAFKDVLRRRVIEVRVYDDGAVATCRLCGNVWDGYPSHASGCVLAADNVHGIYHALIERISSR